MAQYKASEHAKRQARRQQALNLPPDYDDDEEDDDELPPWYFTHGPGGGNNTTKRASEPDAGPTCYWHKNQRPKVEDTFTVVSAMAYHPELYTIHKDGGRDITHPSNTASLNVRSITGERYGVAGTDIARAGGLIMDYW